MLITSSAFNKSSIVNSNNFGIHSTSTWETCICTLYGIITLFIFRVAVVIDVMFYLIFCFFFLFLPSIHFYVHFGLTVLSLLCRRNKMNSFIEIVFPSPFLFVVRVAVVVVGVRSNFHFALRFVFYFNWIKRFITKILTTFHTEFWSLWMCAEMRNILVFFFFFFALWKVLHISRQSKHTFVRQTKNKPPKASSKPGNHAIFTFVFNLKLNRSENARIVWTSNKNDEQKIFSFNFHFAFLHAYKATFNCPPSATSKMKQKRIFFNWIIQWCKYFYIRLHKSLWKGTLNLIKVNEPKESKDSPKAHEWFEFKQSSRQNMNIYNSIESIIIIEYWKFIQILIGSQWHKSA